MQLHLTIAFLVCGLMAGFAVGQPYDGGDRQARRAAVLASQGEVDRAQALLEAAKAKVTANWQANPDVLAAKKDLAAKQAVFNQARKTVVDQLKTDPAYQAAELKAKEANGIIRQEREAAEQRASEVPTTSVADPTTLPAPSKDQIQAGVEKLHERSAAGEMEQKAIAADATASAAQKDLEAASDKVQLLDAQLKAGLLNDPDYKSAFDQLQSARSRLTAAAGQ